MVGNHLWLRPTLPRGLKIPDQIRKLGQFPNWQLTCMRRAAGTKSRPMNGEASSKEVAVTQKGSCLFHNFIFICYVNKMVVIVTSLAQTDVMTISNFHGLSFILYEKMLTK